MPTLGRYVYAHDYCIPAEDRPYVPNSGWWRAPNARCHYCGKSFAPTVGGSARMIRKVER